MDSLPELQLLPVKPATDSSGAVSNFSAPVQAMNTALREMTAPERTAVYNSLVNQTGPAEMLQQDRFRSTWLGLGLGVLLGAGGLYLTGKTLGWCR